jgi:hypothetical protein
MLTSSMMLQFSQAIYLEDQYADKNSLYADIINADLVCRKQYIWKIKMPLKTRYPCGTWAEMWFSENRIWPNRDRGLQEV